MPKLAALMDETKADMLAYMNFPVQHRAKLHSTHPLEQNDERAVQRARYMTLETIAPLSHDLAVALPPLAA